MKYLLIFLFSFLTFSFQNQLDVELKANWKSTPLVLEISEFLHQEDPSFYWTFIERYSNFIPTLDPQEYLSEEQSYNIARKFASEILKEAGRFEKEQFLEMSLILRYFSPKVEFFFQSVNSSFALQKTGLENCIIQFGSSFSNCNKQEVQKLIESDKEEFIIPTFNEIDHIHPTSSSSDKNTPILILNANILKPNPDFLEIHPFLLKQAEEQKIKYLFRPFYEETNSDLLLGGYGVILDIKNVEYKTEDDSDKETLQNEKKKEEKKEDDEDFFLQGINFNTLKKRKPNLVAELSTLKAHLLANEEKFEDLKAWDIKDLGYQASQRIMTAKEPLSVMRDISQSFPSMATSLSKIPLNKTLKESLKKNSPMGGGQNALFINGRHIKEDDIYTLYSILSQEGAKLSSLESLFLNPEDRFSVLSYSPNREGSTNSLRFNINPQSEVFWVIDLEVDSFFEQWPKRVENFGKGPVAKNFFTTIAIVQPSSVNGQQFLAQIGRLINSYPHKIGIIWSIQNEKDSELAKKAMFLKEMGLQQFFMFWALVSQGKEESFPDIPETTEYNSLLAEGSQFIKDFNLPNSEKPIVFVNGVLIPGEELTEIFTQIQAQTPFIEELIASKKITSTTPDIYSVILSNSKTASKFSNLLSDSTFFIDLLEIPNNLFDDLIYFQNPNHLDSLPLVTHLVPIDISSKDGKVLAEKILNGIEKNTRIAFIWNSPLVSETKELVFSIYAALKSQIYSKAWNFILDLFKNEETVDKLILKHKFHEKNFQESLKTIQISEIFADHSILCKNFFNTPLGKNAIITNGKYYSLSNILELESSEIEIISSLEFDRSKNVEELINQVSFEVEPEKITNEFLGNFIMKVSSMVGKDEENKVTKYKIMDMVTPSFILSKSETPQFEIVAILDPLSSETQKICPQLGLLYQTFDIKLAIILNPSELSSLPLKNFYSYVAGQTISFDSNGRLKGPSVSFKHLPKSRLLTLKLSTPSSWLVTPSLGTFDLDNLRLSEAPNGIFTQFQLDYLLITGSCIDKTTKRLKRPRGLELTIGTLNHPEIFDTIVMSNMGYFQLKTNPGTWNLELKKNSKSNRLFKFSDSEKSDSFHVGVYTFEETNISPLNVEKYPEFESVSLFDEDEENEVHDPWSNLFGNFFNEEDTKISKSSNNETLHVFSLASGHLYERFLKIMILSVIKHTQNPVKFWFLANFLSPQFKEFIPFMAKNYGFDYELVTYQWPDWLHHQTEKQRIIWGYKILFLDVLFPLDVNKIIYVDADQVVRTDLKELWDIDLLGAPYGYTPFCSDNHETDGFRFWNSGFWKDHLARIGKPYHISALYVVDLKMFRTQAIGDKLRTSYNGLSNDPNSLANLDQDLPNFLQDRIPIFSLPQEWLWCETWCSQDSKASAKTIDLCNNPLTKTPKLQNAIRIIDEWTDLDEEQKKLTDKWLER